MISRAGTGERIGTEDRIDPILDCALEATFPVSDPVAFPLCGEPLVQVFRNFVEPRGNTASTERPFLSWHLP